MTLSQPSDRATNRRKRDSRKRLQKPKSSNVSHFRKMADAVEKGKKRKKNSDGSSRPSKKVITGDDRKVKISLQDGDRWAPIIGMADCTARRYPRIRFEAPTNSPAASTPGLIFPKSFPLKAYTKPRRSSQKKARGAIATTELLLHSNAHPKLDYTAREEEAAGTNALLKHYVGVYDPETGRLEVMEARKMVVRGVVRTHQATAEDEVSGVSDHTSESGEMILTGWSQSLWEQRNTLGQAFGTKKAKKAIASITENAISTRGGEPAKMDAAAQAMIGAMAKDAEAMASKDQLNAEADASKPRPKANLSAETIEEVYTIDSLIGVDILKAVPVLDWQQAIKAKKEIVVKSQYIANRIQKASTSPEKLRILRYLLLLIELHLTSRPGRFGNSKIVPKRDEMKKIAGGLPEAVIEHVRRGFSDNGIMSKYQLDLLVTHICALACLVDNYTVDLYDLQVDLRQDTKGMTQYYREIGAKVSALPETVRKELGLDKATAAQRKIAKLKLPLDFPRAGFGRRLK